MIPRQTYNSSGKSVRVEKKISCGRCWENSGGNNMNVEPSLKRRLVGGRSIKLRPESGGLDYASDAELLSRAII